jgi:hypothetical protein
MSAPQILIVLAVVWVACLVLGGILHIVKALVYFALLATLAIVVLGMLTGGARRR